MHAFYHLMYRYFRAPWDIGPRKELVDLVLSGRIRPCRAVDLGSGTASNSVFLAQHGFEVTGVDFAASAAQLGRERARKAGVNVKFVVDDLTNLQNVNGVFDLLVDYGMLDDLKPADRELYLRNILPLTHTGTLFLLYCFEWPPRWWEKPIFSRMALQPGEAERRFSPYFTIELLVREVGDRGFPAGYAVYLMTRENG